MSSSGVEESKRAASPTPSEDSTAGFDDAVEGPEWFEGAGDAATVATSAFADAEEAPGAWWDHPGAGASYSTTRAFRIDQLLLEELEEAAGGGSGSVSSKGSWKPQAAPSDKDIQEQLKEMQKGRAMLDVALSRQVGDEDGAASGDDGEVAAEEAAVKASQVSRNAETKDDYLDAMRLSLFPVLGGGQRATLQMRRELPPGATSPPSPGEESKAADGGEETPPPDTVPDAAIADAEAAAKRALLAENALLSDGDAAKLAHELVAAGSAHVAEDSYDAVARVLANPSLVHILLDPVAGHPAPVVDVSSGKFAGRWGCGAIVRSTFTYCVCDAGCSPEEWKTLKALWCRVWATVELEAYVSTTQCKLVFGKSSITVGLVDGMGAPATQPAQANDADDARRAQASAAKAAKAAESKLAAEGSDDESKDPDPKPDVAHPADDGLVGDVVEELLPLHTQLYSWGRGQYGVLGLNTGEADAHSPTPFTFGREIGLVRVSQVSCSWFHTAAVTDMGLLYTWGSGADGALGHGTTESYTYPRLVDYFGLVHPLFVRQVACGSDVLGSHTAVVASEAGGVRRVYTWGLGSALGIGTSKSQWSPQAVDSPDLNAPALGGVQSVACGGGFSAAVTRSGALFTWGKWANGRLGHGPAARSRDNKTVQRYAVSPIRVARLIDTPVKAVTCGESHTLALDRTGALWAFGKGASGQLGTGWTSDCLWPVAVQAPDGVTFVSVAAGAAHSAAIDTAGSLYTWGGAGGLMLGHGDRLLQAGVSKAQARAAAEEGARLGWRRPWLKPRRLPSLGGDLSQRLVSVSCGATHMVALTVSGQLFVWGDNDYGTVGNGSTSMEPLPRLVGCSDAVSTTGSRQGMGNGLSGEYITAVACGGWHTVAVSAGSFLGRDLQSSLPRLSTMNSMYRSSSDVLLVVERQKLPAHNALLSARSPTLRQLIEAEAARGLVPEGTKMELILPDLSLETAVAVLEFMYTDNLSTPLTPLSPSLPRLLAAADKYGLTRLVSMCKLLLGSPFADILRKEQRRRRQRPDGDGDDQDDDDAVLLAGALARQASEDDGEALLRSVLRKGLDGDMEAALVEGAAADLWFTSGDEAIGEPVRRTAAHQVVLCARSQYFNALLLGKMQGGRAFNDDSPPAGVEIDAPDAPITLARMLHYLYTGTLSPATTDQFLQDLVAADRFGIGHLKTLCESAIEVTIDNAPRVLELADLVTAHRLREAALCFMLQHLPKVSSSAAFDVLTRRNPKLVDELLERARSRNDAYFGVIAAQAEQKEEEGKEEEDAKQEPFPWKHLAGLMVMVVLYRMASQYNTAMTNFVPALNVVVLLAAALYAVYTIQQ